MSWVGAHIHLAVLEERNELKKQLDDVRRWFRMEPWKGDPDPGSFGGHAYSANERAIGYGTYRDPRFLPPALREVSTTGTEPKA